MAETAGEEVHECGRAWPPETDVRVKFREGQWWLSLDRNYGEPRSVPIRFCPFCGKKLETTRWRE